MQPPDEIVSHYQDRFPEGERLASGQGRHDEHQVVNEGNFLATPIGRCITEHSPQLADAEHHSRGRAREHGLYRRLDPASQYGRRSPRCIKDHIAAVQIRAAHSDPDVLQRTT